MAYTIVKSNGTVLTTIADGTINTSSTSLGLPGRNYAGYGQTLDTNFVHLLENFADSTPPSNPLQGQLWYNTNDNGLYVCPSDGASASSWISLAVSSSSATTSFGSVSVSGNVTSNNISSINYSNANVGVFNYLDIIANANISNANLSGTSTAANLLTTSITTGGTTTVGSMIGTWTANGNGTANTRAGTAVWVTGGNLVISGSTGVGLKIASASMIMDLNGDPITFTGSYNNSNVATYLPTYTGNLAGGNLNLSNAALITVGSNSNVGTITGNWTLSAGSRLQATYADLAERFEADEIYDAGTVVELGGIKEITAVKFELSEDIFGVISNSAAYLMNSGAGDDNTHPPVAVSGRVQVKVKGKVKKGERLVSAGNGIARAASNQEATAFNTIGRSLTNKISEEVGFVEAIVSIR